MDTKKILIIEDQLNIRKILSKRLKMAGYTVLTTSNGREALKILNFFSPDLILLDIILPGINGYDICKQIKKSLDVLIIFLTALNSVGDQVKGFELGADDYIIKPFSIEEIESRILIAFEKKNEKKIENKKLIIDNITINLKKKYICKGNKIFEISDIEIKVLKLLLSEKNKVFSREEIINFIWGLKFFNHSDFRIVDIYIAKLRFKIEDEPKNPNYIKTVRGSGYTFYQKE
jgi:OmpR family response regulator RpaB